MHIVCALFQKPAHTLGIASLTSLGAAGVLIEVILIGYLFVTSLVGLYTIPFIRTIRPKFNSTTLTQVILNCGLYVVLSSALPLQVKILGKNTSSVGMKNLHFTKLFSSG